jgi:hypothetical protein
MAYNVYIRDHYVHDLDPSANPSPRCSADNPAIQAMQHQSAMISNKRIGHAVAVDFTYTAAQAAASHAAAASANAALLKGGPALGPNQTYALCFSEGGPIVYFSDIFAVPALPPSAFHGNGGDYRNAVYALGDHFQTFLQKKYGSKSPVSCAMNFMPTAGGLKAAQDRKQSMEDTAKRNKAQVVETGWKGKP